MRSLTGTLLAAQQGLAVSPAVRVLRTRASAWENRYVPTLLPIAGGTATDPAAVCAGAGSCSVFALHGGHVTRVTITPVAGVDTVSGPTTLWATADTLIAAAQNGTQVAVLTAQSGFGAGHTATLHLDPGTGTFSVVEVPTVFDGTPASISCCFSPDGSRLFIVTSGGGANIAVTIRTGANTYAALSHADGGAGDTTTVACAYTVPAGAGDLAVMCAATWTGTFTSADAKLCLCLFGDGGLLSAGTWQNHLDVLGVQTLVSTTITMGGLALADTLRATYREAFADAAFSATRNYATSFLSPANAKLGFAREPVPLTAETARLLPAYDPSTGRLYVAHAAACYPSPAVATDDLSARLLVCDRQDAENQARASVLLDNADGGLTAAASDPESCGDRVALDFGYVTAAGAEFSGAAPLFVTAAQLAGGGGSATCTLLCHDAWYLLAAWRPRRLYLFTQTSILHLIQWLLARCGIPLVTPGSPSAALARTPNASLAPSHTAAHALHALLEHWSSSR